MNEDGEAKINPLQVMSLQKKQRLFQLIEKPNG
jgi:hypothetical protein